MAVNTEALQRDVDRHELSIKGLFDMTTNLHSSNKLLEQAISMFSKSHLALLSRFDSFAEEYKNHGYILESYTKSVQDMRETQQDFVDVVKEMKYKNDLVIEKRLEAVEVKQKEIDDKLKKPLFTKEHLLQYKWIYLVGATFIIGVTFFNIPQETQIQLLELIKIYQVSN